MLFDPTKTGLARVFLGGGSSTPSSVRVYETRAQAERMQRRYFPDAKIHPLVLK